jgi:acyl-CoA thioester hydrolase
MGVIHHANYIRWFEEARVDFLDQIGFSYGRAREAGVDFAVLGVLCEYKSMTRFQETIEIRIGIGVLTPTRMTVTYRVTDAATGALRVTGESRHCFVRREGLRPVSLQKVVPAPYEALAAQVRPPAG